jgi:hypothetical protein
LERFITNKREEKIATHNLRLLLAVDMFSGQTCTPDMTVIDLVSDFQPVRAPDKTSVDSPPAKAACRWLQPLIIINMKKRFYLLIILLLQSLLSLCQTPDWDWVRSFGSTSIDEPDGICTDNYGNVYITGFYESPEIFFDSISLSSNNSFDFFITKLNSSGNVLWAKSVGGTAIERGYNICTDVFGNVYATGVFGSDSITFDNITLFNSSSNNYDFFIVKYDSNGNVIWAKRYGASNQDESYNICGDSYGNIYVTGCFRSDTLYIGSFMLINQSEPGLLDFFIMKIDTLGNVIWAKSAGGKNSEGGTGLCVDISNNVYVSGNFISDSVTFGNYTLHNLSYPPCGCFDIFITKYDSNGNVIWAKSAGGSESDYLWNITSDPNGNVYIDGTFRSQVIYYGPDTLINAGTNNEDIFVSKYDSLGNIIWAKRYGGPGMDHGNAISADYNSVYISGGFYSSSINFDGIVLSNGNPATCDIFVAKLDANGHALWAKRAGAYPDDEWTNDLSLCVNGSVYLTGFFESSAISFDTIILTNNGIGADIYIAKLMRSESSINNLTNSPELINIFPNPSTNVFTITFPTTTRQIQIANSTGQIVQKTIVDGQTYFDFTISDSGLYFIQVLTDNQTLTKKLIIIN